VSGGSPDHQRFDAGAFDDLVSQLDSPMAVVTTVAGGERAGCLIGFHGQCSITPRRYAVWLSKANHTYRVGLLSDAVAIHLLAEGDASIAELFGTVTSDDVDKFERAAWTEGPHGLPLLDACPHLIVARRVSLFDDGSDHVCLVTEPLEVSTAGSFRPLRLAAVDHLVPGHEAEDRPHPDSSRDAAS
jgi:flavin reductase (DIM6/NTAB) family NADH-FMN oxidoreductase RutF